MPGGRRCRNAARNDRPEQEDERHGRQACQHAMCKPRTAALPDERQATHNPRMNLSGDHQGCTRYQDHAIAKTRIVFIECCPMPGKGRHTLFVNLDKQIAFRALPGRPICRRISEELTHMT